MCALCTPKGYVCMHIDVCLHMYDGCASTYACVFALHLHAHVYAPRDLCFRMRALQVRVNALGVSMHIA